VIPSLQELHQHKPHKHISTAAESKKVYFSGTPAFVVVVDSFSQNRSSASMSPESIYLTKTRK